MGSAAGRGGLLVVVLALLCYACSSSHGQEGAMGESAQAKSIVPEDLDKLDGFPGELSDGRPPDQGYQRPPTAEAEPLTAAQTDALLSRLEPLVAEASDRQDFAVRPDSLPPPRAGATMVASFPPAEEQSRPADVAPSGPFKVLRYGPEGEVDIAGQISVSFDRPMVVLSGHADSIAEGVPMDLQPAIAGQWRWVGTRTLLFEPTESRLPMATEYRVRLREDAKAADGNGPETPSEWTFATPPPKLVQHQPNGKGIALRPLIRLRFDQRVDPQGLLPHVQLRSSAAKALPSLRLATAEEIAENGGGKTEAEDDGRGVVLIPSADLPLNTDISVVVTAGAPSAEGPRRSVAEQQFKFTTYGPFSVIESRCSWRGDCTPNDEFRLRLSNRLDPEQDLDSLVRIDPPFEGSRIHGFGSNLTVGGYKPGLRRYEVELSAQLRDEHGQRISGKRQFVFDVGASPAALLAPRDGLVTVDPFAAPQFVFHSVNLRELQLQVYRVAPQHWDAYLQSADLQWRDNKPLPRELPGERIENRALKIEGNPEEMVETRLDLSQWLQGPYGHLIVALSPSKPLGQARMPEYPQSAAVWLQVTRIGLDAVIDDDQLHAWATDLRDGSPLADVAMQLLPSKLGARSDGSGLARLQLPSADSPTRISSRLEARQGQDLAFLPDNTQYRTPGAWQQRKRHDELRWHVFDDRALYKPGEQVHLKGWLRVVEKRPDGGLALPEATGPIEYLVYDSRGNEMLKGQMPLGTLGGFALDFKLPDTPNLGPTRVHLKLANIAGIGSGGHQHVFQIQEFRTPEFAVEASFAEDIRFAGDTLQARTSAQYYAGGPLPGAPVSWQLSAMPTSYSPPNQSDYSFGIQRLWWRSMVEREDSVSASYSGQTDASGHHDLAIELNQFALPRPLAISARSSVQDVNRQAWVATAETLVHPGSAYVGMKTKAYFVDRGEPLVVDLIAVDLEGGALSDHVIVVEAGRLDWQFRNGEYREVLADEQRCELRSDGEGLARCELSTAQGGQYRITAVVSDAQGRRNASRIQRWVSGGKSPPVDDVEVEDLQFIPDRDQYGPGDTARILVQAPFADGHGLLTLGRHGVLSQQSFQMTGSSHTLEIPIRSEWLPNVELSVMVVGQAAIDPEGDASGRQRPAQAAGTLNLKLSTAERRLSVELSPEKTALAPGEANAVAIEVLDAAERPVADAEVALFAVDEAILALGGYDLGDPMELFYRLREGGVRMYHLRPTITLIKPLELEDGVELNFFRGESSAELAADAPMMMRSSAPVPPPPPPPAPAPAGGADASPIAIRSDFNPLAVFEPALRTDGRGRALAKFKLPDNLTRYRIMAVAVSGPSHYGVGESQMVARLPLMLRPSPPRFLNFGDRFEFPVVLQNQTDAALPVQLALRASNLQITQDAGYSVSVPPNDRVEVRIPMAADEAGIARYQVAASTSGFADAARGQLPVWTPATSEAFASYGVIDEGALQQPVKVPDAVWPQFGGLSVTTSSTALHSLTDAYIYLHDYPFGCSEQLASRIIATVALRDVLQAFQVPGLPTPQAITERMEKDLKLLADRQNPDGSFAFWRSGQDAWPYISLHATHALLRAKAKGYAVNEQMLARAMRYLVNIERQIPDYYGPWVRRHVIAYALYVRALGGNTDRKRARALLAEVEDLDEFSFESLGWLLNVLSGDAESSAQLAQIRRFLANRTTETAANASFVTRYSDGKHLILHSDRRADAVILDAMIGDEPDSDLIPKLVSGLQAHRVKGRWGNTQDNVFVLLALDRYFQRFESVTPDFVARTWLGESYVGEAAFRGRSTDRQQIEVPMGWLAEQSPLGPLLLAKQGEGRLYYRIGMDYAPRSLQLEPARHGFEVQRRYEAVDDPNDVQQLEDGRWQIRAGAKVAVEITMVAQAVRYHVALVDPLPAGLEVINPDLTPSLSPPGTPRPMQSERMLGRWWWGPWYQHQNLRDNRVEAFTTQLPGGVYQYRYEARATTPGEYVVPPAKAEEMYEPETFGRSGTDRVVVREGR